MYSPRPEDQVKSATRLWTERYTSVLLLGLTKSWGVGDGQTLINCCSSGPGLFKAMEQFSLPLRNINNREKNEKSC